MPYPFQKYGLVQGTVQTVAADAQVNAGGAGGQPAGSVAGYKALVKLGTQFLESSDGQRSHRFALEAGMQTIAEIHQGERTVMEYLLSPVSRTFMEAGRER